MYWALLGYIGLYSAILGSTGLNWTVLRQALILSIFGAMFWIGAILLILGAILLIFGAKFELVPSY